MARYSGNLDGPDTGPCPEDVKSIVCLMLGEIGDILVTTPTLSSLKQKYRAATMSLILRSSLVDLVRQNPDIDDFICYDNRSRASKLWFLLRMMARRCDLLVDLHTPTHNTWCDNERIFRRNELIMRCAKSKYRLGFASPDLKRRLTHVVPVPDEETLRAENIVRTTLRLAGSGNHVSEKKVLRVSPDSAKWAEEFLGEHSLDGVPLMGLFFGAKQPAKVWPYPHVAACCELLHRQYPGHRFVLFGGPHEEELSRYLLGALTADVLSRIVNLVGTLSLGQTAAVMRYCCALVTTDSGPMHMAEALEVPLVALFSSHGYLPVWRPLHERSMIINRAVSCGPCLLAECPSNNLCMSLIQPRDVLAPLDRLLADAT